MPIEARFTTDVIARQVATDPEIGGPDLETFFRRNPEFDIRATPVDEFVSRGADLTDIGDQDALVRQAKKVQRVTRLAGQTKVAESVRAVLSSGFGSGAEIAADTARFREALAPRIGDVEADEIAERAIIQREASQAILMQALDATDTQLPMLTRALDVPEDEKPTWLRLFGSQSSCGCEHCGSVYSPAAYLTDLLQFLREAPTTKREAGAKDGPGNLLELIRLRRPDIEHILLECKNTKMEMPYIDLVNELLEDAVARLRADGSIAPFKELKLPPANAKAEDFEAYRQSVERFQTNWGEADSARRLRAQPEH